MFPLSKSFNTQVIREDYLGYKSRNQYNERLREIFMSSGLNGEIKSVTGGGKTPYQNDGNYEQINFSLAKESDHPAVARKILGTLQGQGISASVIIMVYEKDDHVYELRLSQADYSLSEQELERKIRKLK